MSAPVTGSPAPFETVAARPPQGPGDDTPVPEEGALRLSRRADEPTQDGWTRVCRLEEIDVEGGVTALVDGRAVAVFRTHDDEVCALDNYDPFSRASVLSRGIVGTRTHDGEQVPYVASPMYKQGFALRTGHCLDDAAVRVVTYDVRLVAGPDGPVVHVGAPRG